MLFKKHLFTEQKKQQIVQTIAEAEKLTSGEIRVHTERHCKGGNVLQRAVEVFHQLKMNETAQRNGVLIYLAYADKKFAIIGDKGINEVVPPDFWNKTKDEMAVYFKQGKFKEGVEHGIREASVHLAAYFPHRSDDKNELSNEISEG